MLTAGPLSKRVGVGGPFGKVVNGKCRSAGGCCCCFYWVVGSEGGGEAHDLINNMAHNELTVQ